MFSFTPRLSASTQQLLLFKKRCFNYMEIIQFPQSSLDGGSKWLQACTHSPITKADDGQLSEKEHQRKLRLALFFNLDGNTLVMVINVNGTLTK